MAKRSWEDIPNLPGYLTVAQVSAMYGVHKGTIYYMIFESKRFRYVYKVTKDPSADSPVTDKRPMLLLTENEVKQVMAERNREPAAAPALLSDRRAWNKRVKAWGRATNWSQCQIQVSGPPQQLLVDAYLKANPDDPKPGS